MEPLAQAVEAWGLGTLLPAVGSILVAMLGLVGVVYTVRGARDANQRSEQTVAWKAQIDALQKRADSWRDDVDALRADRDEDRARHAEEIAAVREDLTKIQKQATEDRLARYELVHWARAVMALLRQAGITFPPPPPGVADTDPGLTTVRGQE